MTLLLLVICSMTTASGQETLTDSFRAYPTHNTPPAQAAIQLQERLQRARVQADVVPDNRAKRLLINGPARSHQLAAEYTRTLRTTANEDEITLKPYPLQGTDLSETIKSLRRKYADQDQVRIGMDTRNNQVLVYAQPSVHAEITKFLAERSPNKQTADPTPKSTVTDKVPSLSWVNLGLGKADATLQHITWQQLVEILDQVTADKLSPSETAANNDMLEFQLPAKRGQTKLLINPTTQQYRLEGNDDLVRSWSHAIRTIDQRSASRDATTQVIPIKNQDSAATITRAVGLLQSARENAVSAKIRWGGDLVGIESQGSQQSGDLPTEQVATDELLAQNAPQDQQEPQEPTADEQADRGENTEIRLPGGEVGVDGSMIGPVQIEFVEGLDSIIIRGRKPDVERVMKIIDDIERLSIDTEPSIELIPLKHVNSLSMAELVTELNTQALAARRGSVSITPLVKPNAILLIGREEGVKATADLIERLDQPVAPASQFKIFQLSNSSATDAQLTIETFFSERGGLGPVIQVQADFRTNSLIVYASPRDMEEVGQLIKEIDVNASKAVDEVRVFKLNNALAEELAPVLQATLRGDDTLNRSGGGLGGQGGGLGQQGGGFGQNQQNQRGQFSAPRSSMLTLTIDEQGNRVLKSGLLTNVRVAADIRANSLVVTAPSESMSLIAALVQQLDELPTSEAQIKVFTILNGDAPSLAETLQELFGETDQQDGPTLQSATGAGESSLVPLRFSVDLRTNSIIATGGSADLGVVEAILLRLDEDDISQRRSRVYRLMNAPALDVATAINEFLRSERDIQLVNPDAISPFEQIEREVVVVPEVVSNSLIISSTPRYFEQISEIVEELDERPPMVMIQVLIAEVDLGNQEEFGVELGLQDSLLFDRSVRFDPVDELVVEPGILEPGFNFNNQPLGNAASAAALANKAKFAGQALSSFALSRTNADLGYGGLVLSASSESVNLLIRALRESRRLDVLSRPQVMTLNNQPAFVLVGQRVPYVEGIQVLNSGQSLSPIEFENVGLVLGVTPRISPDGLVVMEIDAEKSKLSDNTVTVGIAEDGTPLTQQPIDTTTLQTTVSARSGQTVILGGLITKGKNSVSRRVPYLADVPLVGELFRYDNVEEVRTELLIIMTPRIVRKEEDLEILNQVESERMSWCLADVIEVDGDTGLSGGGINRSEIGFTELIYPNIDPSGNQPLTPEEVPMPGEQLPTEPPSPGEDPTTRETSATADEKSHVLTQRFNHWFKRRNKNPATEFPEKPETPLDSSGVQPNVESSINTLTQPPLSDIPPVSPAQYVVPKKEESSTWNKLRAKLSLPGRGKP
ncbi:MAG: secretin N-terminal domain-containing protein [Pirellulaceae bacterium]|nr:secretin N-terminal domain-containing protein [Pirellulaceae bacterium]